jgi:tetratricopeptide (TPR) repeat protein
MIHLLNGILVFWFIVMLLRRKKGEVRAAWMAGLAAFIWLIHPLQLTPVLFIIQRMTEISSLFMLCGCISYLYGRERILQSNGSGYFYLTATLLSFGLLAIFSKENGALLLVYVLVIEYFFMRPFYKDKLVGYDLWAGIVLVLPFVLLLGYVLYGSIHGHGYDMRDFSLGERLLTESRVVMHYLKQIIVPELGGSGLFHDDYPISRGILDPPSTLVSIGFVLLLFMVSWLKKSRESLLSFAILWFFSGHLLESTVAPLELYFDHRNYLPILGFVIVAVIWIFRVHGRLKWLLRMAVVLWVSMLALVLHGNARVWGAADTDGVLWAMERPGSIRAQEIARENWLVRGQPDRAREHVMEISRLHPGSGMAIVQRLIFDCAYGYLDKNGIEDRIMEFRSATYAAAVIGNMREIYQKAESGACADLTLDVFSRLLDALEENPSYTTDDWLFVLAYFRGLEFARQHELGSAIESLEKAYRISPNLDVLLTQVAFLYSAGLYEDALSRIKRVRHGAGFWELGLMVRLRQDELDRWEKVLVGNIARKGRSGQGM